jgi:hypothetical protein
MENWCFDFIGTSGRLDLWGIAGEVWKKSQFPISISHFPFFTGVISMVSYDKWKLENDKWKTGAPTSSGPPDDWICGELRGKSGRRVNFHFSFTIFHWCDFNGGQMEIWCS